MSGGHQRWRNALMRYARRGKLFIYPNTAHSTAGVPFAIRFAAWGYAARVSKRAVRRRQARNIPIERAVRAIWATRASS